MARGQINTGTDQVDRNDGESERRSNGQWDGVKLVDDRGHACIGTLRDRAPYINLFVVRLQTNAVSLHCLPRVLLYPADVRIFISWPTFTPLSLPLWLSVITAHGFTPEKRDNNYSPPPSNPHFVLLQLIMRVECKCIRMDTPYVAR